MLHNNILEVKSFTSIYYIFIIRRKFITDYLLFIRIKKLLESAIKGTINLHANVNNNMGQQQHYWLK